MTEDMKSLPDGLTVETLMAYADAALSLHEAAHVERLAALHPEVQAQIDLFRESRSLLSNAFDDVLNESVPDRMAGLVMQHEADAPTSNVISLARQRLRSVSHGLRTSAVGQAIAACALLVIGVGIGNGFYMSAPGSSASPLIQAGLLTGDHPLSQALNRHPAGEISTYGAEQFVALQSFATQEASLCREYEAGQAGAGVTGIACRTDGGWRVEVLVTNPTPATERPGGFQLASGHDSATLDEALNEMGALPGFDRQTEDCLIANGWSLAACPD